MKDAPGLDPLDPFPTEQLKHILVSTGDLITQEGADMKPGPGSHCSLAVWLNKSQDVWNDTFWRTPGLDVVGISEQSYSWDSFLAAAGTQDGASHLVQMSLAGLNEQSSTEFN